MPHHKGRKRLHLEIKENITKVSEDLKQIMYGQFKNAWSSLSEFAKLPKSLGTSSEAGIQESVLNNSNNVESKTEILEVNIVEEKKENREPEFAIEEKIKMGKINGGRRIDYVLQESPIESFNEYLFALASHACYW